MHRYLVLSFSLIVWFSTHCNPPFSLHAHISLCLSFSNLSAPMLFSFPPNYENFHTYPLLHTQSLTNTFMALNIHIHSPSMSISFHSIRHTSLSFPLFSLPPFLTNAHFTSAPFLVDLKSFVVALSSLFSLYHSFYVFFLQPTPPSIVSISYRQCSILIYKFSALKFI
jgi:hypothetical protein